MKKMLALLVCGLVLFIAPAAARAEEPNNTTATNDTIGVTLALPEAAAPYAYRLTDGYVTSRISLKAADAFTVSLNAPCGTLVLDWFTAPGSYTVSQKSASGAVLKEDTIADGFVKSVLALDADCASAVVTLCAEGAIAEVTAYSAGVNTTPETQAFSPSPSSVDLLIICAEPGAEFQQFGAVLPGYTVEKGIKTAVLYVSDYSKRARVDEALAGFVSAGYSAYPIFGGFACSNYDSYAMAAEGFNKTTLIKYLKEEIALLNPKVIVTHSETDISGAHQFTAECVLRAVSESAGVQKLYTFGAVEGASQTLLDLNAPLNAYNGKSAAEVAQAACDLQISQRVFDRTIDTSSAYTLAYSTVGEDEAKNDLFEHIDLSSLLAYAPVSPSPAPTPEQSAAPEQPAEPSQKGEPEQAPEQSKVLLNEPGMLASLDFSNAPVAMSLAIGALLTCALFLFAYQPIKKRRSKGDAVCICLLPLALGLAASAILAGVASERAQDKPATQEAVASAAPETAPAAQQSATPVASPEPTPEPTVDPVAAFEANYYRKEGDPAEVVVTDSEHGHWAYRTDNLGIDIERVSTTNDAGKPVTYFVADIHMKDISQFRPGFGAEGHTGRGAIYPWIMARRAKAVLWMTGDNLINSERDEKGILIRDGRLFSDANVEDTLAIYPDMTMRIYSKWETRADILLEDGVENTYSFGPTLIRDGVINPDAKYHRVRRINPRAGIGYIEPGHYIAIVVDGRQKDYSVGMTIWEFADLFAEYHCTQAYNLDGGLSAGLIFMGEQLNSHSGNRIGASNDISYQRAVPDGLMFGYSNLVPSETDPVYNNGNKQ